MTDNKKPGFAQGDDETKKMVSEEKSKEVESDERTFMDIGRDEEEVSSERGMGSLNYPEEVTEEARQKGGKNSHSGGTQSQDDEE